MKVTTLFLCIIVLALWGTGCNNDEVCLSNQNAVQAGFFSAWSETDKDSTLTEVSLIGLNREDSIYAKESLSELFMPLDFEKDTTSFIVVSKTLKDTICIVHQKELDFIAGECGYIFTFNIDTVLYSNAFIDSVAIAYPDVKYGETIQNIKLYIY
jgi:hypothetical protein